MRPKDSIAAFGAFVLCIGTLQPAAGQQPGKVICTIADPSPTPLNLRTSPYGRIFGNVRNGTRVTIFDNAVDAHGKPWVFLVGDDEVPLGWAYKDYVKCP